MQTYPTRAAQATRWIARLALVGVAMAIVWGVSGSSGVARAEGTPRSSLAAFRQLVPGPDTYTYDLSRPWTLLTWYGLDGLSIDDALRGNGDAEGGQDIMPGVTAVYAWDAQRQQWAGFFPDGIGVPGANDLATFQTGEVYWMATWVRDRIAWVVRLGEGVGPLPPRPMPTLQSSH